MTNVVEEIAAKSASLPVDLQHEILDFVDFVAGKSQRKKTAASRFESIRGLISRDLTDLDQDLADVRKEMWDNFPRKVLK